MQQVYGDETGAVVGDLGSRTFKFGFAGEDMPRGVIPAAAFRGDEDVGWLAGDNALSAKNEMVDLSWARRDGKIADWDAVEALWMHAMNKSLRTTPQQNPVMVALQNDESKEDRDRMAEFLFEKASAPATFFARNAMLSSFAMGRASAVVVDVGAAKTSVVAVHDGFVLDKTLCTSPIAGDLIDRHLTHLLETVLLPKLDQKHNSAMPSTVVTATTSSEAAMEGVAQSSSVEKLPGRSIYPWCKIRPAQNALERDENGGFRRPKMELRSQDELDRIRPTYLEWQMFELLKDIKWNVCRVWAELNFDDTKASVYAEERYELPDGTVVHLGSERFKSGELLMFPESDLAFMDQQVPGWNKEGDGMCRSLPQILRDSIQKTHVDLRRDIVQQLILVGGGSILPGTVERLTKELVQIFPSALKPRFLTPGNNERLFSCFTGGSILATLGSFQQLWISKQEYEEYGTGILSHRCIH